MRTGLINAYSRFGLTLFFGLLVGVSFGLYVWSEKQIDEAHSKRMSAHELFEDVRLSAADMQRFVWQYSLSGAEQDYRNFKLIKDIRLGLAPRVERYRDTHWMLLEPHDLSLGKGSKGTPEGNSEDKNTEAWRRLASQMNSKPLKARALLDTAETQALTTQELMWLKDIVGSVDRWAQRVDEFILAERADGASALAPDASGHATRRAAIMLLGGDTHKSIESLEATVVQRLADEVEQAEKRAMMFRMVLVGLGLVIIWVFWRVQQAVFRVLGTTVNDIHELIGRIGSGHLHPEEQRGWPDDHSVRSGLLALHRQLQVGHSERESVLNELRESREELTLAQSVAEIGSWVLDIPTGVLEWSRETRRIFGVNKDAPVNLDVFLETVHPDDRDSVNQAWREAIERQTAYDIEHRIVVDGQVRWVRERASIEYEGDRPVRGIGSVQDITARRDNLERLRLAASVFSHAREGIMITDAQVNILDVNEAFSQITGYSMEDALGRNPSFLRSGRQEDDFYQTMWGDLQRKGFWTGELWNQKKSGEIYPQLMTISSVLDDKGEVSHYVALFNDISEQKRQIQQLEYNARFDPVTGLANRYLLATELDRLMAHSRQSGDLLLIAYLDLDGFKKINDEHGHSAGDQVLRSVAWLMREGIDPDDVLARLGGDEFVAVMPASEGLDEGLKKLSRLIACVGRDLEVEGRNMHITVSAGVTVYPQAEIIEADQLLRQADQAMYQAKVEGRDRFKLFDAAQDLQVRHHHKAVLELEAAIEGGQLQLYYQPRIELATGKLLSVEALIRWNHPTRGLLSPMQFLPLVERHPLDGKIGRWVMSTALKQKCDWAKRGLHTGVSVNISAYHMMQTDFIDQVKAVLDECLCCREERPYLEIEVLESSYFSNLNMVADLVGACRGMGLEFALDDFGTGYSTLAYLKRFQVDTLKIDQSFVKGMLDEPASLAIIRGIQALSEAFQCQVVAEGIETLGHVHKLVELGVKQGQGYAIARPMPAEDLFAWSGFASDVSGVSGAGEKVHA